MDAKSLNCEQWYALCLLYGEVKDESKEEVPKSFAIRCENTQFVLGWKCGGFTFGGHTYHSFRPLHKGVIAMLAVRDDFLKWVTALKKEHKDVMQQPELF